ncbi:MAG: pentapeptide repeat-containing protein, partial [Bacteroidetes bacterium]|nr:pentapeptide repeat-containing protein [Bacteroidota bacterium]
MASFERAQFHDAADFGSARFKEKISFTLTIFNKKIDFRNVQFVDKSTMVDFSLAVVRDTVLVGIQLSSSLPKYDFGRANLISQTSSSLQRYDFMRANLIPAGKLNPGSKIILYGPVDLKIQLEKLEFVELCDTLSYYAKKDIISVLKDKSFERNKAAWFEIDYLFAKSTMYQKVSTKYEKYSVFHPLTWLKFIYNATMGLGFRPFRLIYWVILLIVGYGVFYMIKIPDRINEYIRKEKVWVKNTRRQTKINEPLQSWSSTI